MYREDLINKAMLYREQGYDLPADLWSDLLNAGICPKTLMSEEDYFEHQEYMNQQEG